ncbi:SEL1-like repeat protein [Pacificimonas flava]|uniref:Sel1 repeat family protein n=1 Tax=Pacificimonas flava TaxID=1234595 RepID=M2T7M6_9SPHN|nr:SEL1-like repeat protein [Pacificimonas flava]EMD82529.1 hypothetical protein C725_2250 [Pacificimonas flava]MBB5281359.1 hypothetical protein [Pacificimonas flava]
MTKIFNAQARDLQRQLQRAIVGEADALYELGVAYSSGREGMTIDLIEAHKWFNLAAMKGDLRAAEDRRELSAEMSKVEIAEAQREARAFLSRQAA